MGFFPTVNCTGIKKKFYHLPIINLLCICMNKESPIYLFMRDEYHSVIPVCPTTSARTSHFPNTQMSDIIGPLLLSAWRRRIFNRMCLLNIGVFPWMYTDVLENNHFTEKKNVQSSLPPTPFIKSLVYFLLLFIYSFASSETSSIHRSSMCICMNKAKSYVLIYERWVTHCYPGFSDAPVCSLLRRPSM